MRQLTFADRDGVSMLAISDAAESVGLHTLAVKLTLNKLIGQTPIPYIIYWQQRHFMVIYKVTAKKIWVTDPTEGKFMLSHLEFLDDWAVNDRTSFILLLEPTATFLKQPDKTENHTSL
jgi:ATP-binding cassette subfamily B protein